MSFDLHSIDFSGVKNENKDLYKYIYGSLDGTIYDIAQVVHFLYKEVYKVAKLKSKLWFVFDGLKWKQSELGPYYELSQNVVDIYNKFILEEMEKKVTLTNQIESYDIEFDTNHEITYYKNLLKTTERIISNLEKIVVKLKSVHSKEAVCKECLYLFYDPELLSILDTNSSLICFTNGVLDLQNNILRKGESTDNISIVINVPFITPKTKKQKTELTILLEEFHTFRHKITLKRKNKLLFQV